MHSAKEIALLFFKNEFQYARIIKMRSSILEGPEIQMLFRGIEFQRVEHGPFYNVDAFQQSISNKSLNNINKDNQIKEEKYQNVTIVKIKSGFLSFLFHY